MRIILLSIAFIFLAFSAQSQVLKSAGVWYFLDVDSMTARPAVLPNGTELAYVVGTKTVYYWNRATSTWAAYGSTFNRDSIYFDASIIGSGTVSDPWGVDSTLFATISAVGDSIAAAVANYFPLEGGTLTGTGGAGFLGLPAQSGTPSTPAAGFRLFANGAHNLAILDRNGWITTFDISAIANRDFTYPSTGGTFALGTGTADRSARWTATNTLAAGNITDNGTKLQALLPWQFQAYTTAGLPTGVTGYTVYNTTTNGLAWYQGSRWAYGLESTFNRGTATRVPFFDANGQVTDDSGITYSAAGSLNILGASVVHDYGLSITSSITTNSTGSIGGVNIAPTLTYSSGANPAAYGVNIDPTFSGSFGGGYAGLRIATKSQYSSYGSAMIVLKPSAVNGIYIEGTASRALIELIPTAASTRALSILNTSDNNFSSFLVSRGSSTVGVGAGFRVSVAPSGVSDSQVGWNIGAVLSSGTPNFRNDLIFQAIASTPGTSTTERFRLTSQGSLGLGTATPEQEIHVVGDGYITDSLRVGTLPNQTSATKILSSDASGWVGYRAFSDFASTWLKTELEASRDVTITGGSSTDFTIQNTRVQFDGKFKVGSDSTFYHDPSSNDTYAGGNFTTPYMHSNSTALYSDVGGVISRKTTYAANQGAYYSMSSQSSSGWLGGIYLSNLLGAGLNFESGYEIYRYAARERYAINHYILDPKGGALETYLQTSLDTAIVPGSSWAFIRLGGKDNTIAKSLWFTSAGSASVDTAHFRFNNINGLGVATGKFLTIEDNSSPLFVIRKSGSIQFNTYGTPATTAAALSKTLTNYGVGFATDGTVTSREIKRDTTIFLTADTDYDFSAAVTTAQIARRYNRIIIHMTLTSGVGVDKTTTLHTPDANLMQCEILIRGTDNTGTYDNEIAFGTNNAISSDGTNTSGYTLAQGQGLHVRVVYNGSAYKYIYY